MSTGRGAIPLRVEVPPAAAGDRLDRFLAAHLDEPRSQVQRWIRDGRVRVGGAAVKPSLALAGGEEVSVEVPPPEPSALEPESGALSILHEDDALIVLDKPPDMTVHPGAGRPTGTLVHRLLARYPEIDGVGGPGRPGIVHRLDKDTSGVLVVARTAAAYRSLQKAFAGREVDKRYLAVVYGTPRPDAGEIDAAIGRHPEHRKRMTVLPAGHKAGRRALTHYRTLAAAGAVALLELAIETGRTHQIRVHLKHLRHPLVGDPVYGEARWKALPGASQRPLRDFPRPALHAWRLAFTHPTTGERAAFEAPVPQDLRELWEEVTATDFPVARPLGPRGDPRDLNS